MKLYNYFICLLVTVVFSVAPSLAQSLASTDISAINTILYSKEISAKQGEQLEVSLFMKNSSPITLFQTDVVLPEGFTLARKTNGKYNVSLVKERLSDPDDNHAISANLRSDGSIRILCSSQDNCVFDENDGKVATLVINVAQNMPNGEYAIKLNNQKLVRPNNIGDNIEEYQVVITVGDSISDDDSKYDINGDGEIDIQDVTMLINRILKG